MFFKPSNDVVFLGSPGGIERGESVVPDPIDVGTKVEKDCGGGDMATMTGSPETAGDVLAGRILGP